MTYRQEPAIIIENDEKESDLADIVAMENLLEKLKLLNYESELVKLIKMKPLSRHYFLNRKNTGEQYFMFVSIAAWLFRKLGKQFDEPQEYDDPNLIITNILEAVRSLDYVVDFSPNKLRQGNGHYVIEILDFLSDEALKVSRFIWKKPVAIEEKESEQEIVEDDSEVILDRIEEIGGFSDDNDEDDDKMQFYSNIDEITSSSRKNFNSHLNNNLTNLEEKQMLISNVDADQWKLELERVLPQLKITIKADGRDWRTHLERMINYREDIKEAMSTTKNQLEKLYTDIHSTTEKISNREKHINSQLSSLMEEYSSHKDEVEKLNEYYRQVSGGIVERTRELTKLNDQLDNIKLKTEQRGNSMNDGTPLLNMKKAVTNIKNDLKEMDIRIGILQSIYFQTKILMDKKVMDENLDNNIVANLPLLNLLNY